MSGISTQEMFDKGLHYVAGSRYRHPSTSPFVSRKGTKSILDIEKAQSEMEKNTCLCS